MFRYIMDGCNPLFWTLHWRKHDISEVGCVKNGQLRPIHLKPNRWQQGGFTVQATSVRCLLPGLQVKNIIVLRPAPVFIINISTVMNIDTDYFIIKCDLNCDHATAMPWQLGRCIYGIWDGVFETLNRISDNV